MGTLDLMKFWSSIIDDDSVQGNLKPVMSIEDIEERALQLVSRTLFLLVMEIKLERDEATKNLKWIKENVSICSSCREKILDDAVDISTIERADLNCTKFQNQREIDNISSTNSPVKIEITSKQINQICEDENIKKVNHDALEVKERKSRRSQNKANRKYRCLSRSPNKVSPKSSKEDEGVAKHITKTKVQENVVPNILVPETLSLDEHELYVNLSKRKALATQTVSVPETLAMDDIGTIDKDEYENTDFFDSNITSEGETCDEKVKTLDSHVRRKIKSPSKDEIKVRESEILQSPVLGKQNRVAASDAVKQSIKADLSRTLDFEDVDKESLEIRSPDSRNAKAVNHITSTPKYSPLLFTHNLSTSLNNSGGHTSPSLLPTVNGKNASFGNEENWTPSSSMKPLDYTQNQEQSSVKTRKGFQRSKSNCNMSPPTAKASNLRKYQSVDRGNKGILTIEPADPKTKKKYRQTKISASVFQQKTDRARLTGGGRVKSFNVLDEVAAIGAALEESIKTKALDDMMREKRKALLAADASSPKTLAGATTIADSKNTGGILNDTGHAPCSSLTAPSVSHGVQVTSKTANCSPCKEKIKGKEYSPIKIPKLSPGNCKTNLRKRQRQGSCSPVKKGKVKKQKEMKTEKEEEVLDMDQLLDQVSPSQEDAGESVSKTLISPHKKAVQKTKKKEVFIDSFDIMPVDNMEPKFAYRGEVVRKKAARKQLEGWQCHECEQWYKGQDLSSGEIKMIMNKCSRHRSKHNPVTNTPKNFWNPDWIDED